VRDHKKRFEVQSLIVTFIVVGLCELFFLIDVMADLFRIDIDTTWIDHDKIELFSTVVLGFALALIGKEILRLLSEHKQAQDSIDVAKGELLAVIKRHFEDWKFTRSESEVALFLIKGLSTKEIADIRQTKAGTVKSQTNSIYSKAEVKGRNELVTYFVEDLLTNENIFEKEKDNDHT